MLRLTCQVKRRWNRLCLGVNVGVMCNNWLLINLTVNVSRQEWIAAFARDILSLPGLMLVDPRQPCFPILLLFRVLIDQIELLWLSRACDTQVHPLTLQPGYALRRSAYRVFTI